MIRFERLLRQRRWVLAVYSLLVLAAAPGLLRLRIDNSPAGFMAPDAESLARFESLERTFGPDRGVRLILEGDGIWTPHGLAWLQEFEHRAEEPGGVYGAIGPVRHHRWHLEDWPPADPETFRELLRSDRLDRETGWIDREGTIVSILAGLYRMSPERRRDTLEALERLLGTAPDRVDATLVGVAVVNRALDEAIAGWAIRLLPWLLVAATALLYLFFRKGLAVLLPLALVLVTQTVLFGGMGFAGQRLDVVTMVLAPLMFVIALAAAVHVLAYHRGRIRETGESGIAAVADTYREKAWPLLWTGLTTCAGFGSLALGEVPSIRALGLWAAFGIAFLTLAALSFYPALMASLADRLAPEPSPRSIDLRIRAWAKEGARRSIRRRRRVGLGFALVALAAAPGLPRLEVETDVLGYFPAHDPVRSQIERLAGRGLGAVAASLVIESPGDLRGEASLGRLRELTVTLRQEPLVLGALGLGDLEQDAGDHLQAMGSEARGDPIAYLESDAELSRLVTFLVDRDGTRTRIVLFLPMRGFEALDPLFQRVSREARATFPEAESHVTGQYPLILDAQRTLLRTMVLSFALTFGVVAAVFALLLRSRSLAVRALIPNAWPVLVVLGTMGWLSVPIDSSTVMIAAVVLGLAVDDTLHTLGHFRLLAGEHGAAEAAIEAVGRTGSGHVASSTILALGFAICGLSSLVPVARFGALSGFAILAALAADLWLVPVLLASARLPEAPHEP